MQVRLKRPNVERLEQSECSSSCKLVSLFTIKFDNESISYSEIGGLKIAVPSTNNGLYDETKNIKTPTLNYTPQSNGTASSNDGDDDDGISSLQ